MKKNKTKLTECHTFVSVHKHFQRTGKEYALYKVSILVSESSKSFFSFLSAMHASHTPAVIQYFKNEVVGFVWHNIRHRHAVTELSVLQRRKSKAEKVWHKGERKHALCIIKEHVLKVQSCWKHVFSRRGHEVKLCN